jgi:glycosyltransferase involved in cell wall biosynthesis
VVAKILLLFERFATKYTHLVITAHDLLNERIKIRNHLEEKSCIAILNYPSDIFFNKNYQGNNQDLFKIVYPGTVSYLHGIDIMIKAVDIVTKENCKIQLDIYGKLNNAEYYEELKNLIKKLQLENTVAFHGTVPHEEIPDILCKASIGVIPKRGGVFGSEAFSTKILEFMAVGVPVIVSKTKIDEFYFSESQVLFFEPENHLDLAERIIKLYNDEQMRKDLSDNGKKFSEINNWEHKKIDYLNIIKDQI